MRDDLSLLCHTGLWEVARPEGLEPPTCGFEGSPAQSRNAADSGNIGVGCDSVEPIVVV